MSREEILAGLRRLGDYDNANFQRLYGTEPGFNIEPTGDLTQTDIDLLDGMVRHSVDDDGTERGVIIDRSGVEIAAGHVLNGLQAGFNYNPDADLNPGGLIDSAGRFSDHDVDNLFTSTLSGDLGQSVWQVQDGNTHVEGNTEYQLRISVQIEHRMPLKTSSECRPNRARITA